MKLKQSTIEVPATSRPLHAGKQVLMQIMHANNEKDFCLLFLSSFIFFRLVLLGDLHTKPQVYRKGLMQTSSLLSL